MVSTATSSRERDGKVFDVANMFINLNDPEVGEAITNLKLQKLLYYAQGFYLALYNKPLFKNDILNWEHGPVVYEVWDKFKSKKSDPLPQPDAVEGISDKEKKLIYEVQQVYGQFSAWKLREMTHREKPWRETERNAVIPHTLLKSYFETRLA